MIYSTEAIVCKNLPYAEADLIVTLFTKEYGLLNLFAKSPRKIKSRFGSSLEPLTYSKISFIGREDKMQKIIQSDILHSFQYIRENLSLFIKTADVLRIILEILPQREPNKQLFATLLEVLYGIENNKNTEPYTLFMKIKTLNILGYLPDFKTCGICRGNTDSNFYYSKGFILCKDCYQKKADTSYKLSQGAIKLLSDISRWKFNYLSRVKISGKLLDEVENFIKQHLSNF
jgi:DNA repair protein RecO (recombination protein O)